MLAARGDFGRFAASWMTEVPCRAARVGTSVAWTARVKGTWQANQLGQHLDCADLDDDGFPELISSSYEGPDATFYMEGWIQVLPGFDLSFEDPTAR